MRARVAANFDSRFLRYYVASKMASDPLYAAVLDRLRHDDLPLLDLGCGAGVLAFYLRESGIRVPISCVDHHAAKIAAANRAARRYRDLDFVVGDVREPRPFQGSVLLLDLLHYFEPRQRAQILEHVAASVAPGGVAIIRDALRDDSWRYRVTYLQESLARVTGWLRAERLVFPTRDELAQPFRDRGFAEEIVPLWGRTPFNNYLFVFRRS